MTYLIRGVRRAVAAAAVFAAAACGSSNSPLAPGQAALLTDTTLLFRNELSVGGSGFFSFVVGRPQPVSVTYASSMVGNTGPAVPTELYLGLGTPGGTECVLTEPAVQVGPALTAQIVRELPPGTYCVRVADAGGMSVPLNIGVRILLSFGVSRPTTGGTELLSSSLAVAGTSMRNFTASESGTATLSLQSLDSAVSAVGVGVGIPRANGAGCFLTQSVVVGPGGGPHISIPVSAGEYCAGVFDTGTLTRPVTFSLQIVHP